eukprot:5993174-Pyramimonas_sp.AAC.1
MKLFAAFSFVSSASPELVGSSARTARTAPLSGLRLNHCGLDRTVPLCCADSPHPVCQQILRLRPCLRVGRQADMSTRGDQSHRGGVGEDQSCRGGVGEDQSRRSGVGEDQSHRGGVGEDQSELAEQLAGVLRELRRSIRGAWGRVDSSSWEVRSAQHCAAGVTCGRYIGLHGRYMGVTSGYMGVAHYFGVRAFRVRGVRP